MSDIPPPAAARGGGDVAHAVEDEARLIGEAAALLAGGDAREHQHRVKSGFDAGDDVRVHAVADDRGVFGVDAEELEPGPHHERIGLSDIVGLLSGGKLNRCEQRAAGGRDAEFGRTGEIIVRADESGPTVYKADGLGDRLEIIAAGLAHDDIVRVHVVIGDANVVERVEDAVLAENVGAAAGGLRVEKVRRCEGARVKMRLVDLKAHARELLLQLEGRVLAGVREEEIALVVLLHPVEKFRHAGQNFVAVIDDTVHIADKALLLKKLFHKRTLFSLVFAVFSCSV